MTTEKTSWRPALAYGLDWVFILGTAAVGGGLSYISPYKRAFSLSDLAISYPYRDSVISTGLLVALTLIIPAVIIAIITAAFDTSLTRASGTRTKWQRKIRALNASFLGLGLSYVLALLLTQMVKNLFGKPRPDLLARCMPDLANVTAYIVGGNATDIAPTWSMVTVDICTNTDKSVLDDGFRSFFSGHSSHSFSGLLYLSLWLAIQLNCNIPFIQPREQEPHGHAPLPLYADDTQERPPLHHRASMYGYILSVLPLLLAIYICATRYQEFKHAGVDITVGILVGSACAMLGIRSYQTILRTGPLSTGASDDGSYALTARRSKDLQQPAAEQHSRPATPNEHL